MKHRPGLRILIFCAVLVASPLLTHGVVPDKHLPPDPIFGKSEVQGLELVRLRTTSGTQVPIVAQSHDDHISLSWWHGVWRNHAVRHRSCLPIQHPDETGLRTPPSRLLNTLDWGHRVGLAAGNDHVFLVFKRRTPLCTGHLATGLFLQVYRWDATSEAGLLPLTEHPIRVPLDIDDEPHSPGYHLWAGYSPERDQLIIATQLFRKEDPSQASLHLLAIHDYTDPSALAESASWTPKYIDVGGYALDGLIEDKHLSLVYRRSEYAALIEVDIPDPQDVSLVSDHTHIVPGTVQYEPLVLRRISLTTGDPVDLGENIPGGEHPRIHSIDPLLLTVDRIESGTIAAHRLKLFPFPGTGRLWLTPRFSESRKVLLMSQPLLGISEYPLMTLKEGIGTKNQRLNDSSIWSSELTSTDPLFTLLTEKPGVLGMLRSHQKDPCCLSSFQELSEWKGFEITFLHHHRAFDGLLVSKYVFENTGARIGDPTHTVFDLNHDQIPALGTLRPSAEDENRQFRPFRIPLLIVPSIDSNPFIRHGKRVLDNTLGGCLTRDRSLSGLRFVAYTDLGDGGTRVIFDEDLPDAEPDVVIGKDSDPSIVSGPGRTCDTKVLLAQESEWESVRIRNVPLHHVGLMSSFDLLAESVFLAVDLLWSDGSPIELTAQRALEIQASETTNPRVTVGSAPVGFARLALDEYEFSFSAVEGASDPSPAILALENRGDSPFSWPTVDVMPATEPPGWLEVRIQNAGSAFTLTIQPRLADVPPGFHRAVVRVRAGRNAPQIVTVLLTVKSPSASFVLSTPICNLIGSQAGSIPTTRTVALVSTGLSPLDQPTTIVEYQGGPTGWLQTNVIEEDLHLSANPSLLQLGTHRAKVTVSAPPCDQSLEVNFFVSMALPTAAVNATEIAFTGQEGMGPPRCSRILVPLPIHCPMPEISQVSFQGTEADWLMATILPNSLNALIYAQVTRDDLEHGQYSAKVHIRDPSGLFEPQALNVSLTVQPAVAYAAYTRPKVLYTGMPILFDASEAVTWDVPQESLAYEWSIDRWPPSSTTENLFSGTTVGDPRLEFTFADDSSTDSSAHTLSLKIHGPGSEVVQVSERFEIQRPIWEQLWEFHEQLAAPAAQDDEGEATEEEDIAYDVLDAEVSLSAYQVEYHHDSDGHRSSVRLIRNNEFDAEYRFAGAGHGQGQVHFRLLIKCHISQTEIHGFWGSYISVDDINVEFPYGRPFTPCILREDIRETGLSPGDCFAGRSAGLCMKPIGDSHDIETKEISVTVDASLTDWGHVALFALGLIAVAVGIWGFVRLAKLISHDLSVIIALWFWNPFGAALVYAALIIVLETQLPGVIETEVAGRIRGDLSEPAFKRRLDQNRILRYSGEGLAEDVATWAVRQEEIGEPSGATRFCKTDRWHDLWQMIYVYDRHALIIVRKPAD